MLCKSTQKSNLAVLAVSGALVKKASNLKKKQSTPKTPRNFMDLESPGSIFLVHASNNPLNISEPSTLPGTDSSHPKVDGWNMLEEDRFLPIFSGELLMFHR